MYSAMAAANMRCSVHHAGNSGRCRGYLAFAGAAAAWVLGPQRIERARPRFRTLSLLVILVLNYANASLAGFYGLQAQGSDWQQLPVAADSGRGGILGMGAVLASQAHSNESSPIKRGVFVRGRLLCQDLPPPPPDVDATPPGLDPSLTTRERFAVHDSNPACSGCHRYIDGVGFGFEGFDGVGARRTTENGHAVDMSGTETGFAASLVDR